MNKYLKYTLIIIFSAIFLFSGYMISKDILEREVAKNDFQELSQEVRAENKGEKISGKNIKKLREKNRHCVGWICVPNTIIDYPVMHTPNNPEKYLFQNFKEKYSVCGTPFMDYRCSIEGTNIIIYGHNMRDGSMFAGLHKYLKKEYWEKHSTIEFTTINGLQEYTVKDVKIVEPNDDWYYYGVDERIEGEHWLTLSTCNKDNRSKRVILIAQRVENEAATEE